MTEHTTTTGKGEPARALPGKGPVPTVMTDLERENDAGASEEGLYRPCNIEPDDCPRCGGWGFIGTYRVDDHDCPLCATTRKAR